MLALAVVGAGACSKGDAKSVDAVCATRAKTQLAINDPSISVNRYPEIIRGLDNAIAVAPRDIKADFVAVRAALKPFVDALVKAGGDQEVAAKESNWANVVADVRSAAAETAGKHVNTYYDDHCGKNDE